MTATDASIPRSMQALVLGGAGGMRLEERPVPTPGPGEVLVRVHAAGVNRADLLQRAGRYPAPAGAPADIPGLELAGVVVAPGPGATRFASGARVFGVVAGGAQAGFLAVDERHLVPVPATLDLTAAAAVPEAFVTAHDALVTQGGLRPGELVLVHAVGSGVGLAAVQLVRALGGRAFGSSRTPAKLEAARAWGMEEGLATHRGLGELPAFAERATAGHGFDVVLDLLGGEYTGASAAVAAARARLLLVGTIAGRMAELPLGIVLSRRLTIRGTVLRSRSAAEKADVTRRFEEEVLPLLAAGALAPVVHRTWPLADAFAAYEHVAADRAVGKVVLVIGD